MLQAHAWHFYVLGRLLFDLHRELELPPPAPLLEAQPVGLGGGVFGGLGQNALAAYPFSPRPPETAPSVRVSVIPDDQCDRIVKLLDLIKRVCGEIKINEIAPQIDRAISDTKFKIYKQKVAFHVEQIGHRIDDELGSQKFLHVDSDKCRYYNNSLLFGADVSRKFPKDSEDIANAGSCYALGLNTACVFHLMRVMERCVQKLGRKLNITLNPSESSWHEIMTQVNKAVAALPGGKSHTRAQNKKKQWLSLAASRLDHIRIVWRNDVMHPKATYDAAEALEILSGVESFLNSVAELL